VFSDINHLYDQVVSLGQTILQVKHGVGDLKAEWLLMKRDLQEVRVEHVQLKTAQAGVREDATRLKAALDVVKSESARLKATQDELLSLSQKLKSRVRIHFMATVKPYKLQVNLFYFDYTARRCSARDVISSVTIHELCGSYQCVDQRE
jgi:regulator of replication initiation timing